jgi:hypothetical protein
MAADRYALVVTPLALPAGAAAAAAVCFRAAGVAALTVTVTASDVLEA